MRSKSLALRPGKDGNVTEKDKGEGRESFTSQSNGHLPSDPDHGIPAVSSGLSGPSECY